MLTDINKWSGKQWGSLASNNPTRRARLHHSGAQQKRLCYLRDTDCWQQSRKKDFPWQYEIGNLANRRVSRFWRITWTRRISCQYHPGKTGGKMMWKKKKKTQWRKVWTAKYWENLKVLNKSRQSTEQIWKVKREEICWTHCNLAIMVAIKTIPPITLQITFWGKYGHAANNWWSCWSHELSID